MPRKEYEKGCTLAQKKKMAATKIQLRWGAARTRFSHGEVQAMLRLQVGARRRHSQQPATKVRQAQPKKAARRCSTGPPAAVQQILTSQQRKEGIAAEMLQSVVRAGLGRKQLVEEMNKSDMMLAMPGTVQNQSGWYKSRRSGKRLLVRCEVDGDDWQAVDGPMEMAQYRAIVSAAVQQITDDHAATLIQSLIRQALPRTRVCQEVQNVGQLLAMGRCRPRAAGMRSVYRSCRAMGIATQASQIGHRLQCI
jgi:hypothetical protein